MSVLAHVARRSAGWGKPIGLLLALLVASSAPAALTVQNYYRLGEADPGAVPGAATNTLDSVGGKHLGVSNAPLYSADVSSEAALRLGSALSMNFSSGTSSVSGVLLSNVTDNFALEAWVKPTSITGPHCIAYNGNTASSGWGIMQYGNTFQGLFGGVTFVGVGPAVLNTWARVALVRNAGTTTLYVNSVACGSTTSTPNTPSGSFAIASSPSSLSSEFFQGLVDEVRFFTFAPGEFTTDQGFWAVSAWTNDASSALAPGVAWAYHFGATTTGTVNGVSVPGLAGGNPAVSNQFAFSGLPLNFLNDSNALTALGGPGSAVLAHDFVYGGNPGTITLPGLTVGQNYRVSILGVGFDAALARRSTFSGGFDSLTMDENIFGNDRGVRLDYTFTARTTNRVISLTPELAGQTFHLYALTLRAVAPEMELRQSANFPLLTSGAGVWGRNNYGQLITPPLGQFGVRAIAAAEHHVVALRNDGTVVAWGNNNNGQTSVPGGLSGVQAIATSSGHTLVLKDDGSLTAWGSIGETYILPGLTGVVAIASGSGHKVVLKIDGSVVAWGSNLYGQTNVPPGLNGVAAIAASGLTSMALQSNGLVTAWGYNNGQASVPAGLSNVVAISLGIAHSMALKNDGTVVAWGANNYGQSDVPAGLSNVMAIAAGGSHSLALKSNGTVVAWGANYSTQTDVPLSLAYSAKAIAAGADHSVALFDSVIDFGNQVFATTGAARTFTITNSGPDPLTLHGVSVVGRAALDFQVNISGLAATVAASNGVATFTVTFTPGGVGERVAKLRVATNDRDENPYEVTLAGVGLAAPEIAVFTGAGTAAANERTDNVGTNVFASTLVGGSSTAQTFTITNLGTTNLTGLALSKSGANSGDFILSVLGATTLAPNAALTFTVTFSPTANGTRRALVALASDDGDENPFRIQVSGPAVAFPEIAVEQPAGTNLTDGASKDFGSANIGTNTTLTFTVRNTGLAELLLTGAPPVAVGGAHAADFTVTAQPASPVLGSGDVVTLTNAGFETPGFAPGGWTYNAGGTGWTLGSQAGVARNGSPWFVNSAPEGFQAAYLQNGGVNATLSRTIQFPSVGTYALRFSMVRRSGGNAANDIDVKMDGTTLRTVSNTEQPDDVWRTFTVPYTCTNAGPHTLAFAGTRTGGDYASAIDDVQFIGATTFQVRFSPTASGLRTATLSITNNDSDENSFDLTLTGTGVDLTPPPPVIRTPSLTVLGNGAFQLNFVNTNNAAFSVLAATNIALPASNWTVLGPATNLGGGLYQFTDPTATNYPGRFYRLRFP